MQPGGAVGSVLLGEATCLVMRAVFMEQHGNAGM
jgi:hypothetical protein